MKYAYVYIISTTTSLCLKTSTDKSWHSSRTCRQAYSGHPYEINIRKYIICIDNALLIFQFLKVILSSPVFAITLMLLNIYMH